MKYFPFFRGKQYELVCIRENAELIASSGYVPIVEPVREQSGALFRALDAIGDAGGSFLVVANPSVGQQAESLHPGVSDAVNECIAKHGAGNWLFQIRSPQDVAAFAAWLASNKEPAVLHAGYTNGKEISALIANAGANASFHVFTSKCPQSYRGEFTDGSRVIIADGFAKQRNADYPEKEFFSDLNVTYEEKGLTGFGDYLIVGPDYTESGGPAYAVAIHLTYLDPDNNNGIYVKHYLSDERLTQTDPAGKFREALAYLAADCTSADTKVKRTAAVEEFLKLRASGHFPGLGYVKKLSMQHHLELFAE